MEPEKKREVIVRLGIILVAGAITAFVLSAYYSVRPVVINTVVVQTETVPVAAMQEPTAAPSESGRDEKAVLVEKSVDLNRAGKDELDQLPGIGPAMAERIIQYREENGGFIDIEEIQEVSGIGDKTVEKIKEYIFVS